MLSLLPFILYLSKKKNRKLFMINYEDHDHWLRNPVSHGVSWSWSWSVYEIMISDYQKLVKIFSKFLVGFKQKYPLTSYTTNVYRGQECAPFPNPGPLARLHILWSINGTRVEHTAWCIHFGKYRSGINRTAITDIICHIVEFYRIYTHWHALQTYWRFQ